MNAVTAMLGLALVLPTAGHDNTVEWNGVTHISWVDRDPICPIDGESFTVSFQTYYYDIDSAAVHVSTNGTPLWAIPASFSHNRGLYDVWTATIPDSSAYGTDLEYYIELTDGTDTDYLGAPGLGGNGMSESTPTPWVLDFENLTHAPLGATLTSDGGAVFGVWAPAPGWTSVRGGFNGWGCTALSSTDSNLWFGYAPNVDEWDGYKFYLWDSACGTNDWDYHEDARYRYVDRNDNSNSVIIDPKGHTWGDEGFSTPPFEEMVVYEMHVGTFSGNNDGLGRMGLYRDVVDTHLDHLLHIGVNAVELMPITEFDYHESWGYNPVNNWAPEEAYGNPYDVKYMIDKLHENGIAVLLDIVYNHFPYDGNYLWWYDGSQIYFDDPAIGTPWGSQADFDRWEVADYFADNVLYWLEEYHVDGFRMDATLYMRYGYEWPEGTITGQASGWDLMQRINNNIDARKVNAISIAEELPDNTAITSPTTLGGAGFDSQWHDRFNDDVRQEIFDAAYGDPEMWRVKNAIIDSSFPSKTHVVNYVEGHDEADDARLPAVIDSGNPYSVWAKGRSKLAQGLTILSPGIPMFLQGGEWLEDIPFGSGWDNRIDWSKAVGRAPMTLFFKDVISVRKSNCGMRSDAADNFHHTHESNNVIAFTRGDGAELLVVASFNNGDLGSHRIGFPHHGTWYEILNSQAGVYDGNGSGNGGSIYTDENYGWDGMPHSAAITVPQMGLLVFRYEDPLGRDADLDDDGDVDLADFAIFQQRIGDNGCGMSADMNEDGRVTVDDYSTMEASLTGPY